MPDNLPSYWLMPQDPEVASHYYSSSNKDSDLWEGKQIS